MPARLAPKTLPLLLWLILATALGGQTPDPGEMALRYAEFTARNRDALTGYGWKMRVEITLQGKEKPPQLFLMGFAPNGELQKTPITEEGESEKRKEKKKKKKTKAKDWQGWVAQVAEMVRFYSAPTPAEMLTYFESANFRPARDGTVQITGRNLLLPADTALFWIDPATRSPRRFQFSTSLEGDLMEGEIEYRQLPDGTVTAARTTVEIRARQIRATATTFDYVPR